MESLRDRLYLLCCDYVESRKQSAMLAMEQAQEAANAEEKSSVGDKYETGRAMAHLEKEKAAIQLAEVNKLKAVLDKVAQTVPSTKIVLGSVIKTNLGNFYVAIGAGKLVVDDIEYLALSPTAPLGAMFLTRQVGDEIVFQNKRFSIEGIH